MNYKIISDFNVKLPLVLDKTCYECKKEFEDGKDRYAVHYVLSSYPPQIPFVCKSCSEK